jgi:hypothetical protein
MPNNCSTDDTLDRYEDSPIAWFGEMLMALHRRDMIRAAEAKRQLDRLGWSVAYRKPRPGREGGAR